MKRQPRPFVSLLLALVLAANVLAQIELDPRVFRVAEKLRCPVCISESVAQSASPTSVEMRQIIADKLEAGESEAEVLGYFVTRYGDWILLEPPKRGFYLALWGMPLLVALGALGALFLRLRRWSRARPEEALESRYLTQIEEDLSRRQP